MCCTFVTIPGGPHVQTTAVPGPILSAASTGLRNTSSARGPLQDMALDDPPMHRDLGPSSRSQSRGVKEPSSDSSTTDRLQSPEGDFVVKIMPASSPFLSLAYR